MSLDPDQSKGSSSFPGGYPNVEPREKRKDLTGNKEPRACPILAIPSRKREARRDSTGSIKR
jgi:hypothetical protein